MRLHRTALAAALAAAILTPCIALGAGYGIYEQGAAPLGMAGAATASVHDASAVFYNPASLVRLDGKQAYFGGAWLTTRNSFAGGDGYPGYGVVEQMKPGNFYPPTVYWANHLNKTWAYGLGLNSPFGLGVDWKNPATYSGRDRVTKADLRTINGNFSLSWASTDRFSLGAGFDALFAGVELNSILRKTGTGGQPLNVADVKLKSGLKPGYGYNVAMLWQPVKEWQLAGYYRSKVNVKIDDGDATFTQTASGDTALDRVLADSLPPSQKVATTLRFPAMWSVGMAYHPTPEWTWEADFNWTQWTAFDKLDLNFATSPEKSQSIVEDYRDSYRINIGAEHRLPKFTYRFGYYFDQAAAPDESVTPLLPDANRHGATLGLGWKMGERWWVDVYNLSLFVQNRSTNLKNRDHYDGTYKAYVNAFGLSLAYHW